MKCFLLAGLLVSQLSFSQSVKNNAEVLSPYLSFLQQQNISARDYVLGLFARYDIVVLCERNHPEKTQYDLIYDIVSSDYFVTNVGNIFTEVGSMSNRQNTLNFVKTKFKNNRKKKQNQIEIYRNGFFPQVWTNTNFYNFMGNLNTLNCKLNNESKVNLYTSGSLNPTPEQKKDIDGMKRYFRDNYVKRDSFMANYIISTFDSIIENSNRKKALVIMNYRHAFSKSLTKNGTVNVAGYLAKHYGDKFANVYINSLAQTANISESEKKKPKVFQCGDNIPIQLGKWDASFKIVKKENLGFDFQNSPFGSDSLDIWPKPTQYKYKDIFTGFIFYLPLEQHIISNGIKSFFKGADVDSVIAEWDMFNEAMGKDKKMSNSKFKNILIKVLVKKELSTIRVSKYKKLNQYNEVINQWITE